MLDQLLTEVPFGVERADILFGLAVTFRTKSAEMNELFEEAVAEAVGDDARSARILALRSLFRLLAVDVRGALTDAHAALERAERVGDPGLLAAAIGEGGNAESWGAEITPGLLERGAALEDSFGLELEFNESPGVWLGRQLMRRGEIDRPRTIFEALEAKAAVRGDEVTRTLLLWSDRWWTGTPATGSGRWRSRPRRPSSATRRSSPTTRHGSGESADFSRQTSASSTRPAHPRTRRSMPPEETSTSPSRALVCSVA